jgi:hypothetical protein
MLLSVAQSRRLRACGTSANAGEGRHVILDQIYLLSHEKTFEIEHQKSKENSATESTDNGYVCFIMAFG